MSTVRCKDIRKIIGLKTFRDAWIFLTEHELFQDDDGQSRFSEALRLSVDTQSSPTLVELGLTSFVPRSKLSTDSYDQCPRGIFVYDVWDREPPTGAGTTFEEAIINLARSIRDRYTSIAQYDQYGRRENFTRLP